MNLDRTADPCQNFYQYACGHWAEEHPIPGPDNRNDWLSEQSIRVDRHLRAFLKRNNSEDPTEPLSVKQARSLYRTCLDRDAMDALGYATVKSMMLQIGFPAVPRFLTNKEHSNESSTLSLAKWLGRIKRYYGKDILIGWDMRWDPHNSSVYRMSIGRPDQSQGLPL